MAPRHKLLATLFLLILPFALYPTSKVRAQTQDDLIRMTVTVATRGGFVKGLTREAFQLSDEKLSRQIEFFESADAPHSIGILIDMSKSIDLEDLRGKLTNKLGEELLSVFIEQGKPDSEYFVMAFDDTPRLITDWSPAPELLLRSTNITRGTGKRYTALYDACFAAIEKMQTAHHSRRVLIVMTDGEDNESKQSFTRLRDKLRDNDILLYAIGMVTEKGPRSSLGMESQSILDELARVTGGKSFYPLKNKEMVEVFSTISNELKSQYRIGFRGGDQLEPRGRWHKIKLKVVPPANAPREFKDLIWRSRQGYYTR